MLRIQGDKSRARAVVIDDSRGAERGSASTRFGPPPDADEAGIVEAARRGDRAAWDFLYRRYARVVHAVLLSRVGPGDAEDLVQDVFATAMRSITGVRGNGCIGAWLAAVARNRATDFLRSRRRRRELALGEALESGRVHRIGEDAALEAGHVLAAIRGLPETYRETLTLRLVEGLTGPEISDRLGMTHGSVRVNLCRGMAMLREALGMEGAS